MVRLDLICVKLGTEVVGDELPNLFVGKLHFECKHPNISLTNKMHENARRDILEKLDQGVNFNEAAALAGRGLPSRLD